MRSVVLRSRPGRPWWQLTTRPVTAVVLGLVSLVAAGAQVVLLSSPPPWYQIAVAGFWTLVGVAFVGSAAGTRARARREAARRARRPVAADPFVPVPVVPARRRAAPVGSGTTGAEAGRDSGAGPDAEARHGAGRDAAAERDAGAGRDAKAGRHAEAGRGAEARRDAAPATGAPTADLADAVRTAVNPVVTAVVPAPVGRTGSGLALAARLAAPSLPEAPAGTGASVGAVADPSDDVRSVADPGAPTTRLPRDPGPATTGGTRNRHAVRAVLSAEFATRALEEESTRQAAGRTPLRDGRVRPTDQAAPRPRDTPEEAASSAPTSHTRTTRSRNARTSSTGETRTSHRRTRKTRRGAEGPVPPSPIPTGPGPVPSGESVPSPRQAPERSTPRSATPPRSRTAGTPTPARGTSEASTPPSRLGMTAPPSAPRPTSALTFGSASAADPAPARRREEPRTPAPRDPSSSDRPTRARPVEAGRHARADATEDAVGAAPRSARHAAANIRR